MFQEMLQQRFGRALMRALAALEPALRRAASKASKDDGDKDRAAPGSAGKKRERDMSAEPPAAGDATPAAAGAAGEGAAMADAKEAEQGGGKRQKTEAAAGEPCRVVGLGRRTGAWNSQRGGSSWGSRGGASLCCIHRSPPLHPAVLPCTRTRALPRRLAPQDAARQWPQVLLPARWRAR